METTINKYRCEHIIMYDILISAKHGIAKTTIMLNVKLSYSQLQKYLSVLLEKGFITADDNFERRGNQIWKTTRKGLDFIKNFEEVEEYFSPHK